MKASRSCREDSKFSITPERVEAFVEEQIELDALGFNPQAARMVAEELRKTGLDPATATKRLDEAVKEYGDMKNALSEMSLKVEVVKERERRLTGQVKSLSEEVGALSGQRERITALIRRDEKLHEGRLNQLNLDYITSKRALDVEYKRRQLELEEEFRKMADELKSKLVQEMSEGCDKLKKLIEEDKTVVEKYRAEVLSLKERRDSIKEEAEVLEEAVAQASAVEKRLIHLRG